MSQEDFLRLPQFLADGFPLLSSNTSTTVTETGVFPSTEKSDASTVLTSRPPASLKTTRTPLRFSAFVLGASLS